MTRIPTFRPAWWLPSAHLQTLWAPLLRKRPTLARHRERLDLADGDFLDLDWCDGQPGHPLVILFHGLTGSSDSHYILGLQQTLQRMNWPSVAVNWRGCSGEANRLPRGYHSGVSEDVAAVVDILRARLPKTPLYAVGYSLGGNVLLKYLGEQASGCTLHGAVAVSVPFCLADCANRIDKGFSQIYQARFMRDLVRYVESKRQAFIARGDQTALKQLNALGPLQKLKTFWDFDDQVTAPLHGFDSALDYYQRASSRHFLSTIRIPTLIIQSRDDPFISTACLPVSQDLSATTQLELHQYGGHVGFIGSQTIKPHYYLEQRIAQWLEERYGILTNQNDDDTRIELPHTQRPYSDTFTIAEGIS